MATNGTPLAYMDRTDDGGVTWRTLVLPSAPKRPAALLCPNQRICWMGGHLPGREGAGGESQGVPFSRWWVEWTQVVCQMIADGSDRDGLPGR